MPRYWPVGVSWGGRAMKATVAIEAGMSSRRTAANIWATVALGPKMTGSVVMSEPAVDSS